MVTGLWNVTVTNPDNQSSTLPASFAVGSPRRFAAHPWATSCTTAENMTRTTEMTILKICVVEYEAST